MSLAYHVFQHILNSRFLRYLAFHDMASNFYQALAQGLTEPDFRVYRRGHHDAGAVLPAWEDCAAGGEAIIPVGGGPHGALHQGGAHYTCRP